MGDINESNKKTLFLLKGSCVPVHTGTSVLIVLTVDTSLSLGMNRIQEPGLYLPKSYKGIYLAFL